MNGLTELHMTLLDDPNNSTKYVDRLMDMINQAIEESYHDGYNDCLLNFEDLGITKRG